MRQEPTHTAVRFPATRLVLAMVISGTVGAFATQSMVDPTTIVFWRCVFATAFLGPWCLLRRVLPDPALSASKLSLAALSGVCMILGWITFFQGMSMTSIGTATIVFHVHPFLFILICVLFLKERMALDQMIWMVSAFLGVALASGVVAPTGGVDLRWLQGTCLTLISASLYAAATFLARRLGEQRPEVTALCQTAIGIILLAPFFGVLEPISSTGSWRWLVGIGMIHTGIAYVLMYSAYPALTAPAIGALAFIYPLVAIIIDWTIYQHRLGWIQVVGMGLIAVGTLGVRLGWRVIPRRALIVP